MAFENANETQPSHEGILREDLLHIHVLSKKRSMCAKERFIKASSVNVPALGDEVRVPIPSS